MKKALLFAVIAIMLALIPIGGLAADANEITLTLGQSYTPKLEGDFSIAAANTDMIKISKGKTVIPLCVGYSNIQITDASGKRVVQVICRAPDDAPVITSGEQVHAMIEEAAAGFKAKTVFRLKLSGLPSDASQREAAIKRYLPDERTLDMPYTKRVGIYAIYQTQGSDVIIDMSCTYSYRASAKVAQKYEGRDVNLNSRERKLKRFADNLIDELKLKSGSKKERALRLHDYLALNCEYDVPAAAHIYDEEYADSFDAYGLLINKKGVCQAYAEAYKLILNAVGMECEYVTGTARGENHSWNRVKFDDGKWHNIDVTFDDPTPNQPGYVSHDYFDISDSELSKTHKRLI